MINPETLPDSVVDTPPAFEGEQTLEFVDYDIKPKEYGFWVRLDFHGPNGERASYSGNFYTAPDTDGRKKAHQIAWGGLRSFYRSVGIPESEIPKASPRDIAAALNRLVSADGNNIKVKALVAADDRGYMNASRFKAA
jgi:hypothetical protein